MYKFKKLVSIILTLVMLIGLVPELSMRVFAVTNITSANYNISSDGDFQLGSGSLGTITIANNVTQVKITGSGHNSATNIVVATGRSSALELTIENLDITAPAGGHGINFSDAGNYAHKLLVKGTCSITGDYTGITVIEGTQLTIDKASGVIDDSGAVLNVQGNNGAAGIGSYYLGAIAYSCGDITINGATVTSTGGAEYTTGQSNGGAGIGNSSAYRTGDNRQDVITINGGVVTAIGGGQSAGIGSGYSSGLDDGSYQGIININGGTIYATGNKGGAGIGSGNSGSGYIINISGGMVTATGGTDATYGVGAGIGGGSWELYCLHTVNISGGTIIATGGSNGSVGAAGIGSGDSSSPGIVNISGGTITATGGVDGGAGVGGASNTDGDTVTITGTPAVIATGGTGAEDIGKGAGGSSSGTLKNGINDYVYLEFHITKSGSNVSGATVNVNSMNYTTNSNGYAYCFAPKANTAYTVNAAGCDPASGTASTAKISNLVNVAMSATSLSNDASLTSVVSQTGGTPGGGSGGSTGTAITWSINVDNSQATVGLSDIVVASGATKNLYSNSGFSTEITGGSTISLTAAGATVAYIKVTAQDTSTIKYYAVTINRAGSNDATLKISSTVKGQSISSLGIPNSVIGSAVAGSVTITNAQATDTSNIGSYITLFDPNDSNISSMKVVKYSSGDSITNFATDTVYANQAISNGDLFVIKVVAQNGITTLYYIINVAVSSTSIAPFITTQPNSQTLTVGQTAIFTVVAGGTATLNYQWRKSGIDINDGGSISGSTTATLTITDINLSDSGNYEVVVTNSVNSVTSNTVSLTVDFASPTNVVAIGENGKVTLSWDSVSGATGYKVYQSTISNSYSTPLTSVAGSVYTYESTGLTNGTRYYFVIRATNSSDDSSNSDEVSAVPKTVPNAPLNVSATAGNSRATVVFDTPSDNGGSLITGYIVTSTPGAITSTGSGTTITVTGLSNGISYTFTVKAVNAAGNSVDSLSSNAVIPHYYSSGSGSTLKTPSISTATSTSVTDSDKSDGEGIEILVNGKTETAAMATISNLEDKKITTVTVNDIKLEESLQREGNNAVVTIPVQNNAEVVVGQLNGQSIKNMEIQEAVLEIKTENIKYTLPASQINIDGVSTQIGKEIQLKDIAVNVKVAESPQEIVNIVENTSRKNNYQVVIKPVNFNITCTNGDKTVEVSKFNGYVERMVAVPEGVDPQKITTGIILNSDGSFSHVPTTITVINNKYYVKINSLTNSTYSVIWNPKNFKDVEGHWAKEVINDVGSRLVIDGVEENIFEPDKDISRGEYVETVVRSLGLMCLGAGKDIFNDVKTDSRYCDAVYIAYKYGIITGYGNGNFGPEDKITREQAMTMIANAMSITKLKVDLKSEDIEDVIKVFSDSEKCSNWAKEYIVKCIKTGIVCGKDNMMLAPKDNITRAEAAVIARGLLQKSKLIN